jgi:voltage-dependent calcium channel L type alpha-1D
MQFFSGDTYDDQGNLNRYAFNSFGESLITVFMLLTEENWNYVVACYIFYHGFGCSLYFVTCIIIGNIMLLNLFLAILLNFISDNLDD